MKYLTRDEMLSAPLPFEDVEVPELGGAVRLQALGLKEFLDLHEKCTGGEFTAHLVAACARDADGKPLFQPADAAALEKQNALVVLRLARTAKRLCGLSSEAAEAEKKISSGSPSEGSSSASPSPSEKPSGS